jgi:hypothetical protein
MNTLFKKKSKAIAKKSTTHIGEERKFGEIRTMIRQSNTVNQDD